jgi:hypothetical protein
LEEGATSTAEVFFKAKKNTDIFAGIMYRDMGTVIRRTGRKEGPRI